MSVAPYVPSEQSAVHDMLALAGVGADDVVMDLGSGDGRVLFSAIMDFGAARAIGYEIREDLVTLSRNRAHVLGLDSVIDIRLGNLFYADLSPATVVTLYLTDHAHQRLTAKLKAECRPWTRIVCQAWPIQKWDPDAQIPGFWLYRL